jgi:two-component system, NtrC family, response regulator AtoC
MKARILVVDDDPHARDLLMRLLSAMGTVEEATGPQQAAEKLGEGHFDLVLTDMAMPEPGDGLKVLTKSNGLAR